MKLTPKTWRVAALATTLFFISGFTECYKPVTKNQLPTRIRTVAVPAFQNQALRYKIEHRFTEAVINEVVRRGRGLRVQVIVKARMRSLTASSRASASRACFFKRKTRTGAPASLR